MCEIPWLVTIHYKLRRLFLCSGGGYKHKRFLRQSWAYWSFRCCELVNSKIRATEVVRSENRRSLNFCSAEDTSKLPKRSNPHALTNCRHTGEGTCSSVSLAPAWHCVTVTSKRPQGPLGPHTAMHFSISQAQAPAAVLDTIWYGRNIFTISM
jgi:hypothetical protein